MSDSDNPDYVAHILPLAVEHSRFGRGPRAAAVAMFVRKASMEGTLRPEIARTYRLTPAELRVLLAMVEEGGVREVSESLGVAETTIKTHLSRLFEKTGAGRQADLIKLVAGYASPLAASGMTIRGKASSVRRRPCRLDALSRSAASVSVGVIVTVDEMPVAVQDARCRSRARALHRFEYKASKAAEQRRAAHLLWPVACQVNRHRPRIDQS